MKVRRSKLKPLVAVAMLSGLLLTATACKDAASSAGAPPNQAAPQPAKAPSSAPTGTPTDGSSLGTPDPDGGSTPPADDSTPSNDPAGPSDPYCKVLESASSADDGNTDGPDTDSPEGIAAVQKLLKGIADQAPDEIRPSMQVIANLLPRADSDDFSQADLDQLTAAQKVLQPWMSKHCPGGDLAGL
jgi:hypothetical protein